MSRCTLIARSVVALLFVLQPLSSVSAAPVMIADLSIHEAKIVTQQNNTLTIEFDLDNGQGAQSMVRYGVSVVKQTSSKEFGSVYTTVDEKVYDEVLSLSPNTSTHRQISYQAPSNLSGTYTIFINAKNSNGLPIGVAFVAKVVLPGEKSIDTIDIIPESCFMTIEGEKGQPHYTLQEGPDISGDENLIARCDIRNNSDKTIEVTPVYETYYRTVYGEKVQHTGGSVDSLRLQPRETRNFSLVLPKAIEPQAYDVRLFFESGASSSNAMIFHYVLRGISATIQTVSLDKDAYAKGDTAKIFFFWSPSADGFSGSRGDKQSVIPEVHLGMHIRNADGEECTAPISQVLQQGILDHSVRISAAVIADCRDPQVSVTLTDAQGDLVAKEREFSVKTRSERAPVPYTGFALAAFIAGLIGIVAMALYLHKRRQQNIT